VDLVEGAVNHLTIKAKVFVAVVGMVKVLNLRAITGKNLGSERY